MDKSGWSRCLLWHGWLPALSGSALGDPWAVEAVDVAANRLEVALGSYVCEGQVPDGGFLLAGDHRELAAAPDVWSDGSLVVDKVPWCWSGRVWCLRSCFWCCLVWSAVWWE